MSSGRVRRNPGEGHEAQPQVPLRTSRSMCLSSVSSATTPFSLESACCHALFVVCVQVDLLPSVRRSASHCCPGETSARISVRHAVDGGKSVQAAPLRAVLRSATCDLWSQTSSRAG